MPVPSGPRVDIKRRLLRDDAHDAIRDAILRGEFTPGERLDDHALQEWLGISRTPIRDALKALEMEGLVESAAQSFTRVVTPDPTTVNDSLQTVGVLIGGVARLTTTSLETSARQALIHLADEALDAVKRQDAHAHTDTVFQTYDELLTHCPNATLVAITRTALLPMSFQYRATVAARTIAWELLESSWEGVRAGLQASDAVQAELAFEAMHRLPIR